MNGSKCATYVFGDNIVSPLQSVWSLRRQEIIYEALTRTRIVCTFYREDASRNPVQNMSQLSHRPEPFCARSL